jgi:hypothetical protein
MALSEIVQYKIKASLKLEPFKEFIFDWKVLFQDFSEFRHKSNGFEELEDSTNW